MKEDNENNENNDSFFEVLKPGHPKYHLARGMTLVLQGFLEMASPYIDKLIEDSEIEPIGKLELEKLINEEMDKIESEQPKPLEGVCICKHGVFECELCRKERESNEL